MKNSPSVSIVEGETGLGKTAITQYACAWYLTEKGIKAYWAKQSETRQHEFLSPFKNLLRSMFGHIEDANEVVNFIAGLVSDSELVPYISAIRNVVTWVTIPMETAVEALAGEDRNRLILKIIVEVTRAAKKVFFVCLIY